MNNPYFDVAWSGGALNMPWDHLEQGETGELSQDETRARVQETRQAAADTVGPHLHVFEVGKKHPF